MARLGRQRRQTPKYIYNRGGFTPQRPRDRVIVRNTRRPIYRRRLAHEPKLLHAPSVTTPTPLVRTRVHVYESRRRAYIRATHRHAPILLKAPQPQVVPAVRQHILVHKRRPLPVRPRNHIRIERAPLWSYPPVVQVNVHKRRPTRPRHHQARIAHAPFTLPIPYVRSKILVHIRHTPRVRHHQARILRAPVVPLLIPYVRPKIQVHSTSKTRAFRHRANTIIVMGSVRGTAGVTPPPPTGGNPRKWRIDVFGFY